MIKGNGTCNFNTEPSNFTNPVVARYVRVIPILWVGASVCLRMELYGCTIKGEARKFNYKDLYIYVYFNYRMSEC